MFFKLDDLECIPHGLVIVLTKRIQIVSLRRKR